ncbi:MAG: adenosylmethionine decarboxylase, partial [Hyphomicrobiaceae bacterium]|nr:adenosylmethionine decarboxylase [Hyphomicrobiaceae bacterium]
PKGKERGHIYLLVGEGHMAFDDALFQLGMDLTRSSTAQKEDHYVTVHAFASEEREQILSERESVKFAGTHLIVDLFGAERLDDIKHVERTLKRCVEVAGATVLHCHLHRFAGDGGISGVVVFDTGHASIRTWPDRDFAAVDLMFMARNGARRERLVKAIEQAFSPTAVETTVCRRANDERRTAVKARPAAVQAEVAEGKVAQRRIKRAA